MSEAVLEIDKRVKHDVDYLNYLKGISNTLAAEEEKPYMIPPGHKS